MNDDKYQRLNRRERLMKDLVLFTLFGVPLIITMLVNSPVAMAISFAVMLLWAFISYAFISKNFDQMRAELREEAVRNIPRDEQGRFLR